MINPIEHAELVAELFKSAAELAPQDRQSFLEERCRSNPELRAEVESLLETHGRAEKFLERPALDLAAENFARTGAFAAGEVVGNYEIVSLIGRGGMGEVYLAQDRQLQRRVALKLVRRGMDTDQTVRRFLHEQRLLASLNHPNIAQLYDAGVTRDGIPFFAMEHVDGTRIDDYCREKGLPVEQRLELFGKVCAAVHYAHQHLVVHRDIKPSNILVTAEGEPKLLDFGIAKLIDAVTNVAPEQTITLQNVLTPEYASPEHVRGEPITTASDVYSLGVLLYELLTGAKPYKIDNRTPVEIARVISEQEPTRPSAVLAVNRKSKIEIRKFLKGDLDNIVLMAMRKEPQRRYASVGQFAADIRRHLDGLPVIARKDTLAYRSSKFIARHRLAVAAAALVGLAVVAALIVSLAQTRNARRQRDLAQRERAKAERINEFLQMMLSSSSQSIFSVSPIPNRRDVTVNQMLDQIAPRIENDLADEPDIRGRVLHTVGSTYASQGKYDSAEKYLRTALDAQSKLHGEDTSEEAAITVELGVLSYREGKLEDSTGLLEKAVKFYREQQQSKTPQFNSARLADALDHLGTAKFLKGDVKSAMPLLNEALQLALDPNLRAREPAMSAMIKMNVGGCAVLAGDLVKGEPLLQEGTAELRPISAEPRWEYGAAVTMLGVAAMNRNNLDEAEKYLAEGEQIYRQTLGDMNPYLRFTVDRHAAALLRKNDLKQAEDKARERWRSPAVFQAIIERPARNPSGR
jgi:serine/threonine protein kinase